VTSTMPSLAGHKVGFIGAGQIGLPMIEMLVRAGADVSAYARRSEARDGIVAVGARAVGTLDGLGDENEVVLSCLFSDAQFGEVQSGLFEILRPGAVFASHTTGSPNTPRRFAESFAEAGKDVGVVDAPFSGTPELIRRSSLTVMLGGAKADVDRVEPVVRAYANPVFRTGELGSALLLKLVNNAVFAANVQIALEVANVARAVGVPLESVYEVLGASSGATRALAYMADFPSPEAFGEQVIHYLVKDVAIYEEVAGELGLDLGLISRTAKGGSIDLSR